MPAPFSTPCISAGDSPSASTVGCCRWSCAWCCRLSRCACSLASAGNVCWAKPNHGFFHCQQPVAIFFHAGVRAARDRIGMHDRYAPISPPCERIVGDASMRCMQAMARLAACMRASSPSIAMASLHARDDSVPASTNAVRGRRGRNPRPSISRRTSRFARKLRGIFSLPRACRRACARFAGAGNEEPATSPARVRGRPMRERISGPRLPAVRRRRPGRAGR